MGKRVSPLGKEGMVEIYEKLSAVQHEIWAHWMRYQFSLCEKQEDGSLVIPPRLVESWVRRMNTPYRDLQEVEQNIARDRVDKRLAAFARLILNILDFS